MTPKEAPKRLSEGRSYRFTVKHCIEMPPDNEEFFVLESETGSKHLLQKKLYAHYKLEAGHSIVCRVDKVNCSGKIFLEPEHPWCQPGQMVRCRNAGSQRIQNLWGQEECLILLTDPWDQPARLRVPEGHALLKEEYIDCRVERLRKGILLVSHPSLDYLTADQLPEADKVFTVSGVMTLAEGLEYFVLSQNDHSFYIRTKYFAKYGLEHGTEVRCRVLDKPALYAHYLEPDHPHYKPGEAYDFDFVKMERNISGDGGSFRLIVRDLLGHEYPLDVQGTEPLWVNHVRVKVTGIVRSKCQLEFIKCE